MIALACLLCGCGGGTSASSQGNSAPAAPGAPAQPQPTSTPAQPTGPGGPQSTDGGLSGPGGTSRYLYALDQFGGAVLGFRLELETGQIFPVGTAFAGGFLAPLKSLDVLGQFLYACNDSKGVVVGLAIQPDGRLNPVEHPLVLSHPDGLPRPVGLRASPAGPAVFVVSSQPPALFTLTRDPDSGALTQSGVMTLPAPVPTAVCPLALDREGRFLYVAAGGQVLAFRVGAQGALTQTGSYPTAGSPTGLAVSNQAQWLYVTNEAHNAVSQYAISATDGALTPLAAVATGPAPRAILTDPAGPFVFVVNSGDRTVQAYASGVDGSLTALGGPVTGTGWGDVQGPEVDAAGRSLYLRVNSTGLGTGFARIVHLPILADGQLGPPSDSDSLLYTVPGELRFFNGDAPVQVTPLAAYVVNGSSNDIWAYRIDPDQGTLTLLNTVQSLSNGPNRQVVATLPSGARVLYVSEYSQGNLSGYHIQADGRLGGPVDHSVAVLDQPASMVVTPDNRRLFVLSRNNAGNSYLTGLSILPDGDLEVIDSQSTGLPAGERVVVDPRGRHLFVTHRRDFDQDAVVSLFIGQDGRLNSPAAFPMHRLCAGAMGLARSHRFGTLVTANNLSGNLEAFSMFNNLGDLVGFDPTPAAIQPVAAAFDPSGSHLFVTISGLVPHVRSMSLQSDSTLTMLNLVGTGYNPADVAVDPSGRFVYVANCFDGVGSISQLRINPDGTLSALAPSSVPAGITSCDVETIGVTR
ncbi:MAG: beta-propeller fold lactonase family protein [Candidatus Eremiobacterota bacterium]